MVGKREIQKDTVQVIAESAAMHVGRIATIVAGAVREVTHEFGEWASDVFEMREAADKASRDRRARDLRTHDDGDGDDDTADDVTDDVTGAAAI